jgi:hypothetical protein
MSNADMPAMPIIGDWDNFVEFIHKVKGGANYGLTKRETFAMHAMQGILANEKYEPPRRNSLSGMADDAVSAADLLLAALEGKE